MGQRTELLPSERAAGYQALAGRATPGRQRAVDAVAQAGSEGRRTVYRYMRLNNLEKPLLDKVDKKEISVYAGAALAALSATARQSAGRTGAARPDRHHRESSEKVVALSRYDVEAIERCLFPVREKEHRPRAAVRAS